MSDMVDFFRSMRRDRQRRRGDALTVALGLVRGMG